MRRLRRRAPHQPTDDSFAPQMADDFDSDSDDRGAEDVPIEPFVSVSGADVHDDRAYVYPPADIPAAVDESASRRRVRLPSFSLGVRIRIWVLLLALALIAGGVFGTLLWQDRLREDVTRWWPVVPLAVSAPWMLIALVRRQVTSFLGGTALAGFGLSALLDAQDIAALRETLLGTVLVTVGLGIVVRGFLLRGRAVRY